MKKLLAVMLALTLVLSLAACSADAGQSDSGDDSDVYLAIVTRTLSNAYSTNFVNGAKSFAEKMDINPKNLIVIESGGSSEKQMSDIKAVVARTKGNVVFNIDPNEAADVPAIAQFLGQQNIPFVTWWNKPDDVWPWDYPSWAMHITFDDFTSGYETAKLLMENMENPYNGKVIAVQGLLGNTAAIERFKGFEAAISEHPEVELVSSQPADWSDTKAFENVSNELVKTKDIAGVWAAADAMGQGAIQALKAQGLAGKIPVTGIDGTQQMLESIERGDAVATVLSDSYFMGGIGLAIAYEVKEGKLNLEDLPHEKRAWIVEAQIINKENAEKFTDEYYVNEPNYTWDDLFQNYYKALE